MEAMVLLLLTALSIYPATARASGETFLQPMKKSKRDSDDWDLDKLLKILDAMEKPNLDRETEEINFIGKKAETRYNPGTSYHPPDTSTDGYIGRKRNFFSYFVPVFVGVFMLIILGIILNYYRKSKKQQSPQSSEPEEAEPVQNVRNSVHSSATQPNTTQDPRIIARWDSSSTIRSNQHSGARLVEDNAQHSRRLEPNDNIPSVAPPSYYEALDTHIYPNTQHSAPSCHASQESMPPDPEAHEHMNQGPLPPDTKRQAPDTGNSPLGPPPNYFSC